MYLFNTFIYLLVQSWQFELCGSVYFKSLLRQAYLPRSNSLLKNVIHAFFIIEKCYNSMCPALSTLSTTNVNVRHCAWSKVDIFKVKSRCQTVSGPWRTLAPAPTPGTTFCRESCCTSSQRGRPSRRSPSCTWSRRSGSRPPRSCTRLESCTRSRPSAEKNVGTHNILYQFSNNFFRQRWDKAS